MRLYYHKTSGGAEYLTDTFIECDNGHCEGIVNERTQYVVRIDGDITKDAELSVADMQLKNAATALLAACQYALDSGDDKEAEKRIREAVALATQA